jgi:hypothetical protein
MLVHSSTIAPMSGCLRDELVTGRENVLAGCRDVERQLAICHHPPEFTSVLGADDRRVGGGAGSRQVIGAEPRCREGQHADTPAGRQQPFHQRDLHQRGRGNRYAAMSSKLALIDRQKAAARGDPVGAVLHQVGSGREEGVEQPGGAIVRLCRSDALAGRTADDLVEDRERPSRGMADIARDARKAGLEHQDPDAGAVDGFAAVGPVRIVIHHRRRLLPYLCDCACHDRRLWRGCLRTTRGRDLAAVAPRATMANPREARVRQETHHGRER